MLIKLIHCHCYLLVVPQPLDTLESTRVSDTSVMLSWTVYEESQQNLFYIQYKRDTDSSWNSREELGTSVEIVDLNPGCHYNFRVHAVSGVNNEVDGSETSISDLPCKYTLLQTISALTVYIRFTVGICR